MKFNITNEYITCLLSWHERVVEVLMRFRHLGRDKQSEAHKADLAALSALIEQGRFFFPNVDKGDSFGADKPPAYANYRNLALDFLVASYNLSSDKSAPEEHEQLELLQRHFTSIVFELVRPKDRLDSIRVLTDRFFIKEESFDDFLTHKDGKIIQHIWRSRT